MFSRQSSILQLGKESDFYLVNKNWVASHAESLGVKTVQSLKYETSIKEVVQLMEDSKSNYFSDLRDSVREIYESIFRDELKHTIHQEVEKGICLEADKSFLSLEMMRSIYLKNHAEELKNGILHLILKDTTDENLKSYLDSLDSILIDRGSYFRMILEDLILHYAPLDDGGISTRQDFYGNSVNDLEPLYSHSFLLRNRVALTDSKQKELKEKHHLLADAIRKLPIPSTDIFSGDGIVLAAGSKHLTGALNIIVQLREMGAKLPVEVVMDSKEDYNKQLCEDTLPMLNGRCLIVEEVLGSDVYNSLKLQDFQNKVLALLVSTFDNTIFLDSDSFPIKNVDTLLDCEPFKKTKFVMWRDMWHKSTSPLFYDIIGLRAGELTKRAGLANEEPFSLYLEKNIATRVLYHDLDGLPSFHTVESGQMVFSKREHFRSLILSFYYNYYGPMFFYALIYQGNFGAGDKDTFVPALHVMNEPYYITEFEAMFCGIWSPLEDVEDVVVLDESTMVQRDPQEASMHYELWQDWLVKNQLDKRLNLFQTGEYTSDLRAKFLSEVTENGGKEPSAFFLHVHNPKINSFSNEITFTKKYDFKSRYLRNIGDFDDLLGSRDWELRFQSINAWVTCLGLNDKTYWSKYDLDQENICKKTLEYIQILKESSNDREAAHLTMFPEWRPQP